MTVPVGRTAWPLLPLKEVTEKIVDGSHNPPPKQDAGFPMLSARNVGWGTIAFSNFRYITKQAFLAERRRADLRPGDVLLTIVGTIGRSAVIGQAAGEFALQRSVAMLRPKGLLSEFLCYQLLSERVQAWLRSKARGSAQQGVYLKTLAALPTFIAPLSEQRQIVAEIEKHLTRLDAAVAALRRVQGQLKRYRAAVLKAACEGRLMPTEAELARQAGRDYSGGGQLLGQINAERRLVWTGIGGYTEPLGPTLGRLNALPDGWVWSTLGQLGSITGGLTKNPKRSRLTNRLPYVRVANVYADELRLDDVESIGVAPSELERLLLRAGDLLIVEGNGSKDQIGRLAVWDGSIDPCVHQNHLIRARLVRPEMARWLALSLLSPPGRRFIELVSSSTSGLYTLSVSKVGALPVPVPPLPEQHRIVAEVERRFSVIEELEATVAANLQRAARLRQSILDRAFRGELVRAATTA